AAAVAQLQDAQPALDAALAEARAAHAATRTRLADLEGALRRHRLGREGLLREENTRNVKLAEVQTRTEDLVANVREDFGVLLGEDELEREDGFDAAAARAEVQELRTKIKDLGAVNALALESYEEEK